MAGREMEIHRGRLDKEILADRAQLLTQFLSKKIFKNFEKYRKTFSFFWMEILNIFENLDFFHLRRRKSRVIFEGSETKKSRFSENFQNANPKK